MSEVVPNLFSVFLRTIALRLSAGAPLLPEAAIPLCQGLVYFSPLTIVRAGLWPVYLLKGHIEKKAFHPSFCELQVNMIDRKAQNWWKVILLNPNLRKIYHLLLRGPA